jgi:hypothetical protein
MRSLLSAAGRAFVRAFLAALIVYAYGVLAAPSLSRIYLVGVSALLGSFAAGIRALQQFVPQLTLAHWLGKPYGDWADSFLQGVLGSLFVTLPGVLGAPDLNTAKALLVSAVTGAFTAGIRALQGFFTKGESPKPASGIPEQGA